jgi:hypothetical protein
MFELLPLEHNVPAERGSFSDVGAPVCFVRVQIRSYLSAGGERGLSSSLQTSPNESRVHVSRSPSARFYPCPIGTWGHSRIPLKCAAKASLI